MSRGADERKLKVNVLAGLIQEQVENARADIVAEF